MLTEISRLSHILSCGQYIGYLKKLEQSLFLKHEIMSNQYVMSETGQRGLNNKS